MTAGSRLPQRRALSEETLRRKTTFDESFDCNDAPQSDKKRRKRFENPLPGRSISEVLQTEGKSLLASFESDLSQCAQNQPIVTAETAVSAGHTPIVQRAELAHDAEDGASMAAIPALPDETDEQKKERSRCVYIDRISIDVTDAMIKQAIDDHLLPRGVRKVQSLEVIRTQKSRHVHAFAILTQTMTEDGVLDVPVGCGEYMKVQRAVKQLQLPPPPKVCRTLHIRIYARRSGWAEAVRRMSWTGLLSILEFVSPGVTNSIEMVADDRSCRSVASHPDNLCCVFFAECISEAAAMEVHNAVHDKTTRGLDNVLFLVRTDFAKGEKKLHDTSVNLEQLRQKYNDAKKFARTAASYGGPSWDICGNCEACPIPEPLKDTHKKGVHDCFEFSAKYGSPRKKSKKAKGQAEGLSAAKDVSDSSTNSPGKSELTPPRKMARTSGVEAFDEASAADDALFLLPRDPSSFHIESDNPWNFGRVSHAPASHQSLQHDVSMPAWMAFTASQPNVAIDHMFSSHGGPKAYRVNTPYEVGRTY